MKIKINKEEEIELTEREEQIYNSGFNKGAGFMALFYLVVMMVLFIVLY